MKNYLEYKDYRARVEFDYENKLLFGVIDGIRDLVSFEAKSAQDIEKEFQAAVDDYLAFCEEVGKEPEKSFKGTFNVRVTPELHRDISRAAFQLGISLNQFVSQALTNELAHQS